MIRALLWRGFRFAFGMFSLLSLSAVAIFRDGALFQRPSKKEKEELTAAQEKFWDLSKNPLPGLNHKFVTLKNGIKLHYVVNHGPDSPNWKNVTIFIHGFPDSYLLWRHLLTSPTLSQSSILIAVDLPGYGGSDGLPNYSPEFMLEIMTAFILRMRERYLRQGVKFYTVAHDWGGIVGARLAAEAPQLADRWIILSAVLPQQAYSNVTQKVASSKQMLHTWLHWPFSSRLLKKALTTISPVLSQGGRSFYIFVMNLPKPLANWFGGMGNFWFLRIIHKVQAGKLNAEGKITGDVHGKEKAEYMAVTTGPGLEQFATGVEKEGKKESYSEDVKKRIKDYGWSEKIRVYREGLALSPWEKSLETVVGLSEIESRPLRFGSGAGLFEDGPPGSLKAPATVIYGKMDTAFEPKLCLGGIGDYLVNRSQVVILEKGGHWLPFEEQGIKVLEAVTAWAVEGEKEPLRARLERWKDVNIIVHKGAEVEYALSEQRA
ncbi:alpha/beta-hydrolase [Zopfia rhizophila CBS 207.26]|uniref:Alpha/beta-hydrolase n=1 Tax=Zopfia rhizophila CBS 207.26 TaxID=1314779 RepID=A0A6A6ES32_9PEZI|nr:alpha/beta-hydrolase [Zopfia rhizophila CBS 207.26]